MPRTFKGWVYEILKLSNDYNAVKRGKVPRRIGRRAYGKASGKVARKLFK